MYTKQKDKSVERMKWWKNGIVRRFKVVIKEIRMKNAKTCYFNWIVCEEWHMVWQQIWQRDKKSNERKNDDCRDEQNVSTNHFACARVGINGCIKVEMLDNPKNSFLTGIRAERSNFIQILRIIWLAKN